MEDQLDTVLHWSNQKEPKREKKIKDEVIRKKLDRIHISAATLPPSKPSRHSQVSLFQKKKNNNKKKAPRSNFLNHSGCQTMHPIKPKYKTYIPHH